MSFEDELNITLTQLGFLVAEPEVILEKILIMIFLSLEKFL